MKNSSDYERLLSRPSLVADIDCEMATRSLREFIRQAWATVEPATPFVPGWHLDAICDHLEAVSRGHLARSGAPVDTAVLIDPQPIPRRVR